MSNWPQHSSQGSQEMIDASELWNERAEKHVPTVHFPTKSKNDSQSLTASKQTMQEVLILLNNVFYFRTLESDQGFSHAKMTQ